MPKPLCIVAGVGPGVGIAVARRFAREGFTVALLARRAEALAEFVAAIEGAGGSAKAYPVDLTDAAALKATIETIEREMGPASVLVYNASLWREEAPMRFDPAAFTMDLQLSATGALVAAQSVHRGMVAGGGGTILFTGGGLALKPEYGASVVSLVAGKAAVRAMTFAMAAALAEDGIHLATVTIAGLVKPGTPFDPDRIADAFWALHREPRDAWQIETVFTGA